ncbi:MAG: porin [Rhodospirillales bacterium]|nr:porin [Rhodospirillales bacterium]MDE0381895.1 porin [Rhodospirillales bacterium]
MKKLLLGTTALVAAGAFIGAAQADEMMAEPVSVGVGGYTTGAVGFASDGDDGTRSHSIDYVYEIGVSGSTTLDNGITVSVSGQLGRSSDRSSCEIDLDHMGEDPQKCTGGTDFDEIHTTLSGSFGALRIGRTESAAFNATVAAPGAGIGGMLGVNYSWFSTSASAVNTYSGIGAEDALKVVYTSPNFNGLTIGMSYAPNNTDENFGDRSTAGLGEHTAAGATYSSDFMEGGSFTLGAGYEMASGDGDPSAARAGINISVDQISFGGSMYDHDADGMQFDAGASWTQGATEVGVQYANKEDGDSTKTALHLTYTLGPGVLIGGQIAAGSSDGDDDVTQFMLGTAVFF